MKSERKLNNVKTACGEICRLFLLGGGYLAGNFDGIKTRNFGIEIEMTGLTRCQAAKALSGVLGGEVVHEGGA